MSINAIALQNDDALANQFQLVFGSPFLGSSDIPGTQLRITNVTIPDLVVSTYTIHYRTQKMTKPSGKDGTANNFSFTFRVDKNWNIYKGFVDWSRGILDPVTGIQLPDFSSGTSPIRVPISVLTIDTNDTPTSTGWEFSGCFPSTVPGVSFDMTSGEPITVAITMEFITVNPLA